MIGISFVGTGNYEEVAYSFGGRVITTRLFPVAFNDFINPDSHLILLTKEADEKYGDAFNDKGKFRKIRIPIGKTETEIWEIFSAMVDNIPKQSEVAIDVTHGFRIQPMIALASILYLKALKDIRIKHILYGAYEAKDVNNVTPTFDLKPFTDIVEWSNALLEFSNNANMKGLSPLLKAIHKNSNLNKNENKSRQLEGAGNDLGKLADSFSTIRIAEVLEYSKKFQKRLPAIAVDLKNHIESKPFGYLLDKINEKVLPLIASPEEMFTSEGIKAQKHLLRWYLSSSQYQKAITLARELMLSVYVLNNFSLTENSEVLDKEIRIKGEKELGELIDRRRKGKSMPGGKRKIAELWERITDNRNDIDHAGMRKNPQPSDKLIANITDSVNKVLEVCQLAD